MGSTHHAIEDYGVLLALQGMKHSCPHSTPIWTRSSLECSNGTVRLTYDWDATNCLRTSPCPGITMAPPHNGERTSDRGCRAAGGSILNAVRDLETALRPELWVVSELPLETCPPPDASRAG